MNWQLIGMIAISAGALLAFFALGRPRRPRVEIDRKIQGLDVLSHTPLPQAEAETIRRFVEALKAPS